MKEDHNKINYHSMKRRCFVHDYKGRAIYLITLEVAGRRRLLGRICGANAPCTGPNTAIEIPLSVSGLNEAELAAISEPLFEPSELGCRVAEEFMKIGEHVAGVKPLLAQAMPDHFHGILFVTREINRSLGSIIAGFKGKCSQIARKLGVTVGLAASSPNQRSGVLAVTPSLWEEGFHDRILTSRGQLERMFRYVRDNPRRLALRIKYPDLFTAVRCLAGHGHVFDSFGNGFLLQRDTIAQVQCSRSFFGFKRVAKRDCSELNIARNAEGEAITAFSTPEFEAKKSELYAEAKKGAVLCSPCISDGEKAIAYAAVDVGYPLIVLRNEPFPARFKPSGRFFDACAEGRLLMLYPRELRRDGTDLAVTDAARRITRAECLTLNAIASDLCGGKTSEIVYRGI